MTVHAALQYGTDVVRGQVGTRAALLFGVAVAQAVLLLLAAPLFSGISRVLRAKFHSRQGPGIWQDYRDLVKLLNRTEVIPAEAGLAFRATPYVVLVAMLLVAMSIPAVTDRSPVAATGDLITVIYLFAMARFFYALAGIDSGSMFAGVGASRETTMGVLNEPVMVLSLFTVALMAGSTDLGTVAATIRAGTMPSYAATLMAMLAFGFAVFVEMGKLPFDLVEAEQELQEGPITEYSGRALGLVKWGMALKQIVALSLFIGVFLPFGSAVSLTWLALGVGTVVLLVKLLVAFVAIAFIENTMARNQFLDVSRITFVGTGAAGLAFALSLAGV
jgi:hydrogenase-4 component C